MSLITPEGKILVSIGALLLTSRKWILTHLETRIRFSTIMTIASAPVSIPGPLTLLQEGKYSSYSLCECALRRDQADDQETIRSEVVEVARMHVNTLLIQQR